MLSFFLEAKQLYLTVSHTGSLSSLYSTVAHLIVWIWRHYAECLNKYWRGFVLVEMSKIENVKRWKWATYRNEYWCGACLKITLLSLHQTGGKNNIDLLFIFSSLLKKYQAYQKLKLINLLKVLPGFCVIKNLAVTNSVQSLCSVVLIYQLWNWAGSFKRNKFLCSQFFLEHPPVCAVYCLMNWGSNMEHKVMAELRAEHAFQIWKELEILILLNINQKSFWVFLLSGLIITNLWFIHILLIILVCFVWSILLPLFE